MKLRRMFWILEAKGATAAFEPLEMDLCGAMGSLALRDSSAEKTSLMAVKYKDYQEFVMTGSFGWVLLL